MRRFLFTSMLLAVVLVASAQEHCALRERVASAVERMLADYPQSTLQDIYKSFFQDRFGPGHIVPDSTKAAAYLQRELSTVEDTCVLMYEPTGDQGNYCRVALAAITSGRVPFDMYMSAFLRSVREVRSVDFEAWAAEWQQIERIIRGMGLSLPGYDADAVAIAGLLAEGHYAVHHSRRYNEHYAPHYRIIAKDIFEAEILPLLR